MNIKFSFIVAVILICVGCSEPSGENSICPTIKIDNMMTERLIPDDQGLWINWGLYDFEIARDGSYWQVITRKLSNGPPEQFLGYHINAVKLLETSPCTNCIWLSNLHKLANGDLSVDISIKHPFDNPVYTGFDVRGIIMFPASQYWPDNELRLLAGYPVDPKWNHRFSSEAKGDAILVNAEGWTAIWAPEYGSKGSGFFPLEKGYPIFEYYPGKMASGKNVGTLNPYRRFYSNPNRHMFEPGKTVTRTYIIRPPASGPIQACYAVYAHWAEPAKIPVTDPASDFPPIANSLLPYEYYVYQDQIIDPDAPPEVNKHHIFYHIKTWFPGLDNLTSEYRNIMAIHNDAIHTIYPDPLLPDKYHPAYFNTYGFLALPPGYTDKLTHLFRVESYPWDPPGIYARTQDWYILDIQFSQSDGEW